MDEWWRYDNLEPAPEGGYDWHPAGRGNDPDDNIDYHIDLGAGRLPKGRLKIDRHGDCDISMNLDTGIVYESREPLDEEYGWGYKGLPFPDNSIKSIISHHCLEHIGYGFMDLMNECYRVLESKGKFRIIVPLFPSFAAVSDPDHVRYFCKDTFESFCHEAGPSTPFWSDSFAEPYTDARFKMTNKDITPPRVFSNGDTVDIDKLFEEPREIRVTLQKP
jgi:SAM-dependent methyltransferase